MTSRRLAASRLRRRPASKRLTFLAVSALLLATSIPMPAGAASQPKPLPAGARDITATQLGSQLLAGAKDRLAAQGVTGKLRVVEDDAGYTIAPVDAEFVMERVTRPDGTEALQAVPVTAPKPATASPLIGSVQVAEAADPSWVFQHGDCFARINHVYAYIDHCYQIYKMSSDGSSTRDYFALKHYATAGPNPPWTIYWAYIKSSRLSGTATQNWLDWDPKGSWTGSCGSVQLVVVHPASGTGLALNVDRCERWDVVKGTAAGKFDESWWNGGTRSTRGLGFEIAVWVAQGAWPQWVIPADADGSAG